MSNRSQKSIPAILSVLFFASLMCGWSFAVDAARDPTQPLTVTGVPGRQQASIDLKLDSVLISPQRKLAVVNGRALQEQEWFGDVKVVKIFPERVEVVFQGKPVTLRLINPIRKEKKVKG